MNTQTFCGSGSYLLGQGRQAQGCTSLPSRMIVPLAMAQHSGGALVFSLIIWNTLVLWV
jgi:hypothetical protein